MPTIYRNGLKYSSMGGYTPAGIIEMYGGQYAPHGWLICDGSAVSRTDYAALYAAIGTVYGDGDGSTTFNLPDLRGRVAVGAGIGTADDATAHALGSSDGKETNTLVEDNLPRITGYINHRGVGSSSNFVTNSSGHFSHEQLSVTTTSAASGTQNVKAYRFTYAFGKSDNDAIDNMQPYLGLNYIISTGLDLPWNSETTELPIVRGVLVNGQSVVGNSIAEIPTGAVIEGEMVSASINVENVTYTCICSIDLPAGVYVLDCMVRFSPSNVGFRQVSLSDTNPIGDDYTNLTTIANLGSSSVYQYVDASTVLTVAADTTYYLYARQNSGTTLTVSDGKAYIKAVQIA